MSQLIKPNGESNMTFSKASRLPVLAAMLCLLLMGFAGTSYGAVRFDVVPSPTEVINTGLSEVTGSINLIVRGPAYDPALQPTGNRTGTSTGGDAQIGIIYNSNGTFMAIDNTTTTGIRIFWTAGFVTAGLAPSIVSVANTTINGNCSGFITINLPYGARPADNDFIRIEGVRGRIASSSAVTQGNDLYAALQSINDPSANSFVPDSVRVAKSLPGMFVGVTADSPLLCFPTTGVPIAGTTTPGYKIVVTEGFARAFVDWASAAVANTAAGFGQFDRVDSGAPVGGGGNVGTPASVVSGPGALGAPTNSTQFTVVLSGIPASVSSVSWPAATPVFGGHSYLALVSSAAIDANGNASAVYSYETDNQTNYSDITIENFTIIPILVLKSGGTATGTVAATVTLSPNGGSAACQAPGASSSDVRPRFIIQYTPSTPATYATIIRCNCFMLFTYVTSGSGFNTGIVVANTSQDYTSTQPTTDPGPVFPSGTGAANQIGYVTFYFYSTTGAYRGYYKTPSQISFGQSFVALLSQMLGTSTMPDTTFSGYIIARAEFQYCHAVSYIADNSFASTAQGYAALIIPDPAIQATYLNATGVAVKPANLRYASDAGDITRLPAGEGLNN